MRRPEFTFDVDLTLPERGITALFGPSGCGKTTALRTVAGLETTAVGRVAIGGVVWQDSANRVFRPVHQRAVGLVFQEPSLFDHLSVEGNLKFGFQRTPGTERRQAWDQSIELLGISHLLSRQPHELSGGERQRVAIARALAASPRVLLMDEPLAAIDAQRKAEILPWLERLNTELDLPVLYVTHSLDEVVHLADHMVILEQGRVVAHGPTLTVLGSSDGPMALGREASVLIEGTARTPSEDTHLIRIDFAGGPLLLPQTRVAPWSQDHRVRIRIQARDVSIALQYTEQYPARPGARDAGRWTRSGLGESVAGRVARTRLQGAVAHQRLVGTAPRIDTGYAGVCTDQRCGDGALNAQVASRQ